MVIDYFGAMLTLAGCALLLLPLIWVCIKNSWTSHSLQTLVSGWYHLPMDIRGRSGPFVLRASSGFHLLLLGVESRQTSDCPQ